MSRRANLCARRLGTVRTDVSQETRLCDRGLFCDVRFYGSLFKVTCDIGLGGGLSKNIRDAGKHESGQQHAKAPHGQREKERPLGAIDKLADILISNSSFSERGHY